MADPLLEGTPTFESLAGDLLSRLVGASDVDVVARVGEAVERFALFVGADRSRLFSFSDDDEGMSNIAGWTGATAPDEAPTSLRGYGFEWVIGCLRRREVVRLSRLPDDLPVAARSERAYAIRTGMKSNLMVPVEVEDRGVCVLSLGTFGDYRAWTDLDVSRARFVAELIASTLHRSQQNRAMSRQLEQIRGLSARLQAENVYLKEELNEVLPFHGVVSASQAMKRVLSQVQLVGSTDSTVLILGETGTGKELVARAIHEASGRRRRALVKVNCAALPAGLVESELFGHEKGAFTGALAQRPGRFEIANGGTLFLDEVGDLPLESQAKLLRVIQDGQFERLGSTRTQQVDVRLVAATNRDLQAEAVGGTFRQDLFYRLGVFIIRIPPLRERREDVEPLVHFIVARRARALNRQVTHVPLEVLAQLRAYDWPGNVRELQNVVERALILSPGTALVLSEPIGGGAELEGEDLESVERRHIRAVLEACGWTIEGPGRAADRLSMRPSTLRSRMKKLGIVRPAAARVERRPPR